MLKVKKIYSLKREQATKFAKLNRILALIVQVFKPMMIKMLGTIVDKEYCMQVQNKNIHRDKNPRKIN